MLNEKGFTHFPDEIDDDVIKIVGEWLKQKHAKESNKERMYLLQELLGELEK